MLTRVESKPLAHLRLSKFGVPVGVVMAAAGLVLLLSGEIELVAFAIALTWLGAGLAFVSGYYWACGNNACSPGDW